LLSFSTKSLLQEPGLVSDLMEHPLAASQMVRTAALGRKSGISSPAQEQCSGHLDEHPVVAVPAVSTSLLRYLPQIQNLQLQSKESVTMMD
jgi:hypothetical protein